MLVCVQYTHRKNSFGSYLLKSILNEWDKLPDAPLYPVPTPIEKPVMEACPRGIPPWVWKQQQSEKLAIVEAAGSLSPEQQAIVDNLFLQLGEYAHE